MVTHFDTPKLKFAQNRSHCIDQEVLVSTYNYNKNYTGFDFLWICYCN